jgi:hypothetical protein
MYFGEVWHVDGRAEFETAKYIRKTLSDWIDGS